jgi:hypothetical protein
MNWIDVRDMVLIPMAVASVIVGAVVWWFFSQPICTTEAVLLGVCA